MPKLPMSKILEGGEVIKREYMQAAKAVALSQQDRMTGTILLHHESLGEQAQSAGERFACLLETREQIYPRRMKNLGEEWTALDCGPLEKVGYVVIENRAGAQLQAIPTSEERKAIDLQGIEVSLRGDGVADLYVAPGTIQAFRPVDAAKVTLRCVSGVIYATTTCVPR